MTEKWARLGDMGTSYRARHGLRAVALKNSMILIYGGGNAGIINELHLYNPVNNQYNIPKVKGQVPSGTAAFGMATDGLKVYIFGGMAEYRVYTNDLFQLDTTNWLWSKIDQRGEVPTPRLGHSFTFVDDNRIFLFGGLEKISSSSGNNIPHYLNDLFVLHILNDHYEWEHVTTSGRRRPSERESHTANLYFKQSENKKYLVIFGGMNGERLGDLWMLDTETLSWSCLEVTGLLPTPRSLHSANLVGKKMYIFGGWITCAMAKKRNELKNWGWKCTDTLYCLDLEKMTWKSIQTSCPAARAGHCTAEYDGRIFLWHGRNGVRTASESAIKPDCYNDAWYLETKTPKKILLLNLLHASYKFLDICWAKCSTADCYLLELRKVDQPKNLKIIDKCYNEEPKSQTSRTPEKPTPKNRVTKRPILKLNVPHKKLLTAIHSNVMLKSENTITATSNKVSTASVVVHGNRRFIPGQVVSLNLSAVRKFPAPSQMRQIMGMKSVSIKPSISFQSLPQMGIVTDENVSKLSTEGVEELDDVSKEVDKMNNNRHEDINVDSTVRSCAIDKRSISEERLAEDCIEEANDSTESETESHEVVVLEEKIIKPLLKPVSTSNDWCLVGVLNNQVHKVRSYFEYAINTVNLTPHCIPNMSFYQRHDLQPGSSYQLRVAGINVCGVGEFSDTVTFETLNCVIPQSPTFLKVSRMSDGNINFAWGMKNAGVHVESYILEIANGYHKMIVIYEGPEKTATIEKSTIDQLKAKTEDSSILIQVCGRIGYRRGPSLKVRFVA